MMPVPGFTENWFPQESCEVLAGLVRDVEGIEGLIVEVGSWEGKSTCALAKAAWPRTVLAVDTWLGSAGEVSATLAQRRDVFARFQANVGYWTQGNVIPHRKDWRRFVAEVTDPVAFVFVDAEHSYSEVHAQVSTFLPLMAPGGIMCGDDAHHPPVIDAVTDLLGETLTAATLWIWQVPA